MKQVLQNISNGQTHVAEVPAPKVRPAHLQIATSTSLVSPGTERMLVDFGRGSMLSKARQQPDKVKQALGKIGTDGLAATLDAVRSKLDQPLALGYCNVGTVTEVGGGITGFKPGDRVASNGKHAEIVVTPHTLCAKVPDNVSDEAASFTVIGAIALQGIRLAGPTLGETVAVIGLGLVGLLTVQILRANGCRVIGFDFDPSRLALAAQFGAETVNVAGPGNPVQAALDFTQDRGVDAVLLTASTKSSDPVSQAAQMSRKKGRIVLVGVTGLELSRADFFEKELTFQVSCSYGPGRYDRNYEDKGQDYPLGHVRWTEQRNFEAVLDLLSDGKIDVSPLITHRYPISEAEKAYDLLVSEEASLGILIDYPGASDHGPAISKLLARVVEFAGEHQTFQTQAGRTGFIGAGNYGGRILIGAFKSAGADLHAIASTTGVSAVHYGKKFGFRRASSDAAEVLADGQIDTLCICSRHDSHKQFVVDGLASGKAVFVEKPLCINASELTEISDTYRRLPNARLMVGYNRRFAPHTVTMKGLLSAEQAPKALTMTINAGAIASDHWTQDALTGGGRIIGECCHFVDLARHLIGHPIESVDATGMTMHGASHPTDTATIRLSFKDGSFAVINYLANGHKAVSKERIEAFCNGKILQLDNFNNLNGHGWKGLRKSRPWRQDKGQKACVAAFMEANRLGAPCPIPAEELFEVAQATIDIAEQLK